MLAHRHLRSGARRRSAAVPAPVLVLLAPGGVHHGAAGDGRGQRDHPVLRAQARCSATASMAYAIIAIAVVGFLVWGHHMFVSGPVGLRRHGVLDPVATSSRSRRRSRCSTGRPRSTRDDRVRRADALRARLRRPVHVRRHVGTLPRRARARRAPHRHVFRRRPLPLHHGGRLGDRLPRRAPLLVAQDHRPPVPRRGGRSSRRC